MTTQKLQTIFNQFDTDNSGNITPENIKFAMQKLGQEIPQQEIDAIIEKHDKNDDGLIQFDEFAQIFKKNSIKEKPNEEVKEEVKEEA